MNQIATQNAFSISPTVTGAFSWSGNVLTFDPDTDLAYTTTYTCTISVAANDAAGNHQPAGGSGQSGREAPWADDILNPGRDAVKDP